jgi:hypothetical protein
MATQSQLAYKHETVVQSDYQIIYPRNLRGSFTISPKILIFFKLFTNIHPDQQLKIIILFCFIEII